MAKNTLSVLIPEIQNQELEVDIVGRTPLLVKRFDEKTQLSIEEKQAGIASRKKEPRKPEEECERARIKDGKGNDCVKAIWFKKGMAAMAGYFGIPRGNIEQGVYVVGDLIPIKYAGRKPIMNTARVRVGQGTMAKTSLAYRPEFHGWSCKLRIGFDQSVITPHQVISLLAHAGGKNGIGEWRPQKGGDFGRFDVFPAGASKKLIAEAKAQGEKAHQEAMAAAKAKEVARGKRGKKAIDVVDVTDDEAPVKRKSGRPKKNTESDVLADAPAPKKMGRPKKHANGVPTVANKVLRRGRPRKEDSDKNAAAAEIERLKQLHGF
jgi:hypothetical protein